jgi:hypothetical protein
MTKALPELKPVERLIKAGSLHAKGALPDEGYQSYPIPVPGPRGLRVAFLYAAAVDVVPLAGPILRSPTYVGFVDAETARFVELRVFHADEVGLAHLEGRDLGQVPGDDAWQAPEVVAKEAALYRGYDAILGAFAAGIAPLPVETKRAADDFAAVFAELAEAPLVPFYRGVGRAFFAWLDRVARRPVEGGR